MAEPNRTSTKIDKAALRRLAWLSAEVQRSFGVEATREAIVSALVLDISVPQLAGILLGYKKDTAPIPPPEPEQGEPESGGG
jgi:hypothetical protein